MAPSALALKGNNIRINVFFLDHAHTFLGSKYALTFPFFCEGSGLLSLQAVIRQNSSLKSVHMIIDCFSQVLLSMYLSSIDIS